MYHKVLVPLDGSEVAECALSQVRNLAKGGFVGEVILLNIVDIPAILLAEHPRLDLLKDELFEKSKEYLAGIRAKLSSEGIKVRTEILEGKAALSITEYSKKNAVDLIVIATHGYTGMKLWLLGSVASRVLHNSHAPVLLVRPESCRT